MVSQEQKLSVWFHMNCALLQMWLLQRKTQLLLGALRAWSMHASRLAMILAMQSGLIGQMQTVVVLKLETLKRLHTMYITD